jgi:hypothetical protein
MSLLESLFTKYGTDKGIWGYTPYYEETMEKRRFDVKRVLEIGICGYRDIPNNVVGASLFVWRDYFPNAAIYGIDNDPRFIFTDQGGINTALADAYDPAQLRAALDSMGVGFEDFDMIVDDAVHDPEPQVHLAKTLIPYLKRDGGRYFIEEACGYKMPLPTHEYFLEHLANTGIYSIASCVTPKPEELVILVK